MLVLVKAPGSHSRGTKSRRLQEPEGLWATCLTLSQTVKTWVERHTMHNRCTGRFSYNKKDNTNIFCSLPPSFSGVTPCVGLPDKLSFCQSAVMPSRQPLSAPCLIGITLLSNRFSQLWFSSSHCQLGVNIKIIFLPLSLCCICPSLFSHPVLFFFCHRKLNHFIDKRTSSGMCYIVAGVIQFSLPFYEIEC